MSHPASPRAPRSSCRSAQKLSCFSVALGLGGTGMGAADARRQDLVGDMKIPYRGATGCGKLRHQLRQVVEVLESSSREPESARDSREIAVAEHRPILGQPLGAELVPPRAVRAVVDHDDEDVQAVALDGL